MSFPAPTVHGTDPPPAKRGWPGAAKVVVAVLAATTIGAVVAGVVLTSSAKSDKDDVDKELAATQDELDSVRDDLDSTQEDLDQATKDLALAQSDATTAQDQLASTQSDLEAAQADVASAQASTDALRGLFPVGFDDFAAAPLSGPYTLALVGAGECTGYADNDSACSAENLPSSIDIIGDPAFGYTVSSPFFADTPLVNDAGRFTADGNVVDSVADLCNGEVTTTTFSISITVAEVGLTSTDTLQPTLLFVHYSMATDGSSGCSATSRDVDFDGTRA